MMPENENIWIESLLQPRYGARCRRYGVSILIGDTDEPVKIFPTTIVDRTNYTDFLAPNSHY